MSQEWHDEDLLDWTQKTLPEFLLVAMQDPSARERVIGVTPWEKYEVSVKEVQVDGEANLSGKHGKALFYFDLDLGLRFEVRRREHFGAQQQRAAEAILQASSKDTWTCIAHMLHFENTVMTPAIIPQLEVTSDAAVAEEVGWYVKEGMGRRYIWYALARWHAFALRKWTEAPASPLPDPYTNPDVPPLHPPFKRQQIQSQADVRSTESDAADSSPGPASEATLAKNLAQDIKKNQQEMKSGLQVAGAPIIGKKDVRGMEQKSSAWATQGEESSGDEEDVGQSGSGEWMLDPVTMSFKKRTLPQRSKKYRRYPYLPSMLAGVAGPAVGTLPYQDWSTSDKSSRLIPTRSGEKVTGLDLLMNKNRLKQMEVDSLKYSSSTTSAKAMELCDAIAKGEAMKAMSRLSKETVNCAHPKTGRFAIHHCVETFQKELLQMVLEAQADVNVKDREGQTALMLAAKQQSPDLVKVLLDAGADAAEEDTLGRSASDMVKASSSQQSKAEARQQDNLKAMIEDKERPTKYGAMLISAIEQKDARTAESSIDAGGDVNTTDAKGDSALILLAKGRWKGDDSAQVRIIEKAHKAGALVNFKNRQGSTALLYGAYRGNSAVVEALLKLKADVDVVNKEGNTALMYAAHGGHESICTLLLEHFATTSLKNASGFTAEQVAAKRGFRSVAILIQAYELAPKTKGDAPMSDAALKTKKEGKAAKSSSLTFDYSKWNSLEKEMAEDEELENQVRQQEANALMQRPGPMRAEDMGPEAFGLPANTPWPPVQNQPSQKGPFDYSRWDKIVDDAEKQDRAMDRYEYLQQNPQYEWRDGQKMRVIY
mmetsp:Transcript_23443/g.54619  ORF Transcript_23443/g.54619 Transcript_23443/m.54619 type:complete len:825 (-) Transcript_23443:169-2643(-)